MKTLDELTVEEIGKLESGPETDWLIALLMPVVEDEEYELIHTPADDVDPEKYPEEWEVHVVTDVLVDRFIPSTNANDAVLALATHEGAISLFRSQVHDTWSIRLDGMYSIDGYGKGTFCMAACKALLDKYLSAKKGA